MPEHTGSMLRGAFGVALRSLTCITGLPNCKDCPLKQHCKFPHIFENPALQPTSVQAVNPYIIHVPINSQVQSINRVNSDYKTPKFTQPSIIYKDGDIWQFGMTLMGAAIDEYDLVIKAWQLALRTGLGAYAPYKRATLLKVTTHNDVLYQPSKVSITEPLETYSLPKVASLTESIPFTSARWQQLSASDQPVQLTLKFLTPFRHQQNNRIISQPDKLDSTIFIASLYNRIRLCQDNHSPTEIWDIGYDSYHDFKDDLASLDITINVVANHVARRSSRQQRKMALYGLQGDIYLLGDPKTITRLLPALLLGERLHLGKNTTMGLGQYQLMLTPIAN